MSDEVLFLTVRVTNSEGVHARPADLISKLANRYRCRVSISKGTLKIDAKSILSILTLVAECGTELVIEAEGPDAQEALAGIAELFQRNFDEGPDQAVIN